MSPSLPRPARRAVVRCLSSARVRSAPRRRASPPSRPDAVAGRPVWRFVTHAGRGRCRFRRRCRRRGLRSRSGLTARRSRSRKILLTQILYDRYSPRYSTSESYMCTTYCAHVSRNRRPLASPLPVARAQASAAQERLCKPAPPPMWSSSSQPSCSRLLEMRLIPLAFGGCQIAEEVLSFFGIGNDSA